MALEGNAENTAGSKLRSGRRLRLGMVGGGRGSFVGPHHRLAARMDDHYELVAGALSSDPERARASAADWRIDPDRAYSSYEEMAKVESQRADGIDVAAIATPNHLHAAPAIALMNAGIHVICDKPITTTLEEALELVEVARKNNVIFGLTHTYTGYPMARQAREMVAAGDVGTIRTVQVEYPQDWLTTKVEESGHKQADWRTDPERSGAGGCIGDIGTHAFNMASFISGLELDQLCADVDAFVDGRRVDDNIHVLMRFKGGAKGMLWASQVAPGNENGLRVRIFGDKGGVSWEQERPDQVVFTPYGEPTRTITRGGPGSGPAAGRVTRVPPGHPEGFLEGFGNLYSDMAEAIAAHIDGRDPDPAAMTFPTVEDGARTMKFLEAALDSSAKGGVWVDGSLKL